MGRAVWRIAGPVALYAAVAAAGPTTVPATDVAAWLAMLSSPDPVARHDGRFRLMGLTPADLPTLRETLRRSGPPDEAAAAAVQESVEYVLMREAIAREPLSEKPLLGVYWPVPKDLPLGVPLGSDESDAGVLLDVRYAGFVAARHLDNGDRVLGEVLGDELLPVRSRSEVVTCIQRHAAGDVISLLVQRGQRTTVVTFPLDALPVAAAEAADADERQVRLDEITSNAREYAASVFRRDFAGLLAIGGV